jgi:hypothetical protein
MTTGTRFHVTLAACLLACRASTPLMGQSGNPVTLVRELRLDGIAQDFSSIIYYAVSPSGLIAVPQPQDYRLIFFDPSGRRINTAGRRGSGPGEFIDPVLGAAAGWIGDSLWIMDQAQRQLTMFGPDGKFVRTWSPTLTMPNGKRTQMFVPPRALYPDGSMLAEIGGVAADSGWDYAIVSKGGDRIRTLHHVPFGDWVFFTRTLRGTPTSGSLGVPFSVRHLFANSPDGKYAAVIEMLKSSVSVSLRKHTGTVVYARTLPVTPVAIPARVADSIVTAMRLRPMPGVSSDAKNKVFEEMRRKLPATYASVLGARIGYDGTVWLRMYKSLSRMRYLALDAAGVPFADFELPVSSLLMHGSRTHVWLLERDDDGIPSVVRYRVDSRQVEVRERQTIFNKSS